MVDLRVLRLFGGQAVEQCKLLKTHVLVSGESELKDMLGKVREFPLLVSVLPSSEGDDRGSDNYAEKNSGLFYVLKPYKETLSSEERIALWVETQQAMKEFKEFIKLESEGGDFFEMLRDADFGGRDIEPEYNLLGCIGWSLLFHYTTDGL